MDCLTTVCPTDGDDPCSIAVFRGLVSTITSSLHWIASRRWGRWNGSAGVHSRATRREETCREHGLGLVRRAGRVGDSFLISFCTVSDALDDAAVATRGSRFDSEKSRKVLPVTSSIWIALPILARSWRRVGTGRTDVVAARERHALNQILIMDTLPQVARHPRTGGHNH